MKSVAIAECLERRYGEVVLTLAHDAPADPARNFVRALHYEVRAASTGEIAGNIDLRLGYTTNLVLYGGHFGYGIHPAHRGRGYAAQACLALRPVAVAFGMDVLWITCNPDNWASRRTCERVGSTLVEIVDLPPESDMYLDGERQKCRYRWLLY